MPLPAPAHALANHSGTDLVPAIVGLFQLDNLPGMHVAGFWSAFWTSVLVSLVSFVGSWFVGGKGKVEVIVKRH